MACIYKYDGRTFSTQEELKLYLVEKNVLNGLAYAEVMLPAWSKQFFERFVDKDGNFDQEGFNTLARENPELLDMIGYRIPTEGKYSMLPLRVKGFLPMEAGGAIMLPAEITTISGSD